MRFINGVLQVESANGSLAAAQVFTIRSSYQTVGPTSSHNMFDFELRDGWRFDVLRVVGEKEDNNIKINVELGGTIRYSYTGGAGKFDEANIDGSSLGGYVAIGDQLVRPQYRNYHASENKYCEAAIHFKVTPP